MAKKKNKKGIPKRKRMTHKSRLLSGESWVLKYDGKNIIKGFSNWYGVSNVCAILELRMLGIEISEQKLNQAKLVEQNKAKVKKEKKEKKEEHDFKVLWENSDENFYFIAGYTSGGAPYGVTWDEVDEKSPWEIDE